MNVKQYDNKIGYVRFDMNSIVAVKHRGSQIQLMLAGGHKLTIDVESPIVDEVLEYFKPD